MVYNQFHICWLSYSQHCLSGMEHQIWTKLALNNGCEEIGEFLFCVIIEDIMANISISHRHCENKTSLEMQSCCVCWCRKCIWSPMNIVSYSFEEDAGISVTVWQHWSKCITTVLRLESSLAIHSVDQQVPDFCYILIELRRSIDFFVQASFLVPVRNLLCKWCKVHASWAVYDLILASRSHVYSHSIILLSVNV